MTKFESTVFQNPPRDVAGVRMRSLLQAVLNPADEILRGSSVSLCLGVVKSPDFRKIDRLDFASVVFERERIGELRAYGGVALEDSRVDFPEFRCFRGFVS